MRLIFRLIVLAFAALGVKTLYDKFAGQSDELKETGNKVVDRAGTAARDIRGMASDAAQHVASRAQTSAKEVTETARASAKEAKKAASDNAEAVKQAAVDLKDAPTT